MLCQNAIMVGVGVGREAATPLGALFQFFLRDLVGMLGGIVFAYCQGRGLDTHAKQWRLFADCINNVGLALELASPLFPRHFLAIACLGSVARSLCGVAAGATRAALTQHFALRRNAADIAAKEGSQETATTLVGMAAGMATTHLVSGSPACAWATFLVLTALHVYFNVRAVRSLCLRGLNEPRLEVLAEEYLRSGAVMTPEEAAGRETLLTPPLQRLLRAASRRRVVRVRLGAPVAEMVEDESGREALCCRGPEGLAGLHRVFCRRRCANVVLHRRAGSEAEVLAFLHACAVMTAANSSSSSRDALPAAVRSAGRVLDEGGEAILRKLRAAGWDLSTASLPSDPWRAEWPDAADAGTKME